MDKELIGESRSIAKRILAISGEVDGLEMIRELISNQDNVLCICSNEQKIALNSVLPDSDTENIENYIKGIIIKRQKELEDELSKTIKP